MRKKKKTGSHDWFFFSTQLYHVTCQDYISLKILYYLEPLTCFYPILRQAIEVAEKCFKIYLRVTKKETEDISKKIKESYRHNVEKLRLESAKNNELFDDEDIKSLCNHLNSDELFQYIHYGSEKNTDGMEAYLWKIIPVIDKLFFICTWQGLPEQYSRLFNFGSSIKFIVTANRFDQSQNRQLIVNALENNNVYFEKYKEYCELLDRSFYDNISSSKLSSKIKT